MYLSLLLLLLLLIIYLFIYFFVKENQVFLSQDSGGTPPAGG